MSIFLSGFIVIKLIQILFGKAACFGQAAFWRGAAH